jgi:tetratricopeptide (TPR) repeat protein
MKSNMAGNETRFAEWMSEGHSAAWDQEWPRAVEFYEQALREFPDNLEALSNLASALFELRRYKGALQYYQKVAAATPGDPIPFEKIARIFEAEGNYKGGGDVALHVAEMHFKGKNLPRAVEYWTLCVQLTPDNLRAHSRLALVYERQRQKRKAVREYLAVASLLQHAGEREKAIDIVKHAIQLLPESSEASQALGLLRANQPLPRPVSHRQPPPREAAEKTAEDALPATAGADKDDPIVIAEKKALSVLAELMFELGEEDTSPDNEKRLSRNLQTIAMGTGPLNQIRLERTQMVMHVSQGVDFQSRGRHRQAAEELTRAIDAGLDQPAAYFNLGLLESRVGRFESAMRNLQKSVRHPDFALGSRLLMGEAYLKLGRQRDSSTQFLEALRLADAYVVEPEQREGLKRIYEPLIDSFAQDPDLEAHEKISRSIAELLITPNWVGKLQQARGQLPNQPEGVPPLPLAEILTQAQSSQVVEMLGHIHKMAREGHYRHAMEEAFMALQYAPTYLPLHTFIGDILIQQELIPEAITKFNTVARSYTSRGEAGRSIELYRRITELVPLDLPARQQLIEQLMAYGQIEEGIREYLVLGDVYYRLAELDKARETYQKALNTAQQSEISETWSVEILHHLADIDLQRLDWTRALKIFEQIARIDPGNVKAAMGLVDLNFRLMQETEALAALGNFVAYLNKIGKEEEVISHLENIMIDYPDQIALMRTMAEQCRRLGRAEEAIEYWDKVGDALIEIGDVAGAVQAVQAILSMNPPNAADYQVLLRELQAKR